MTLEKLRREFFPGSLSFMSCCNVLLVYVKVSNKLIATIHLRLDDNGIFQIEKIDPIIKDQEGSRSLMVIIKREKIPYEVLTKADLKRIKEW